VNVPAISACTVRCRPMPAFSRLARSHLRAVSTAPSARAFWPEPFGIPAGAPRRIGAQKPPTTAAVNRPDLQRLTDQISATIGARGGSVDPPSSTDRPQLRGAGGGVISRRVQQGRVRAAPRDLVRVELERATPAGPRGTIRAKPPSTRFQPRATDRVCPKIAAHVPEPEGRTSSTG
jgi:hypothetical protein